MQKVDFSALFKYQSWSFCKKAELPEPFTDSILLWLVLLATSCSATSRQLLIFFSILKLFFTFFATFISFRKKSQLNSTGLYYCMSVWTPGLAQLPMPLARLFMRSVESYDTFFKMADNAVSDSHSSWGGTFRTFRYPEIAKIGRERKIRRNPPGI